jgi:hypothetical protein
MTLLPKMLIQLTDSKLQNLQRWIAAPNWTNPFNTAKGKRLINTGQWILKLPEYTAWLAQKVPYPSNGSIFAKNVLVISGMNLFLRCRNGRIILFLVLTPLTAKPGYGKTILSTRIIEELQRCLRDKSLGATPEASSLAYFYFDQQQADRYSRVTALQAVAAQLLFAQRNNHNFIDITSLKMLSDGEGEICASEQALESLIRIFINQLDESYLVFDGLDECAEWEDFLISLRKCVEHSTCKVVLLARPHLSIASIIGQKPFQMELAQDANLGEITAIIKPGITSLIAKGKLGPHFSPDGADSLITRLARRADSIVLWASLMIQYLQSRTLTPIERAEVINEDVPFKGLENLYSKILEDLARRVPETQHRKIHKVFEWLVAAQQSWTPNMLELALAVKTDRPSCRGDFIENFEETLLQLCGPLVEIRQDRIVRFIHLSVAEYLTSAAELTPKRAFSVGLSAAHCSTANLCLAYLKYEIPHHPLGGTASSTPHPPSVVSRYGLLPYAVSYWSQHAMLSLAHDAGYPEKVSATEIAELVPPNGVKDLVNFLRSLATDKPFATAWIEASWTFQVSPSFLELPHLLLTSWVTTDDQHQHLLKKDVRHLGEKLRRFSSNLLQLNKQWGLTLAESPNEVWLPSINVFMEPEFWVGTDAASLTWLGCPEDTKSVLIVSQSSLEGKDVGIVRVWPSKYVTLSFS